VQHPIAAEALTFTKWAALMAGAAAVVAAALLVVQGGFEAAENEGWPESTQVALLGLVGLATLAVAIAAAADVLARAIATANVVVDGDAREPAVARAGRALAEAYRPAGKGDPKPALQEAADRLALAYEEAQRKPKPGAPATGALFVPAPTGMKADVTGVGADVSVVAIRWEPPGPHEYLILDTQNQLVTKPQGDVKIKP
jgi:Zn-dependent protease with chaperone function